MESLQFFNVLLSSIIIISKREWIFLTVRLVLGT
jgi:hypothetical protein